MKKIGLKLISIRFIFIAFGIMIGLFFMAQLRTIPDRITNPATPVLSLRETRDILLSEQNALNDEANRLQDLNKEIEIQIKSKSKAKPEMDALIDQKLIAGLTTVQGPGVEITLDDSKQDLTSEDAIVHAADLRDVINLLWSSGAEAISLNGQRIVFTTAIDCIVNTIMLNNVKISAPFVIKTAGDTERIRNSLESPLNLADLKSRSKNESLVFDVKYQNEVQIPAFKGSFILTTGSNAN